MAQIPREELLEAGRKKLKDYQLRRRSTNISTTTRHEAIQLLTENGKRTTPSKWRSTSLLIDPQALAKESPDMFSPSTIASPTTLPNRSTPASPLMHTEQYESNNSFQVYPSPPLSRLASFMVRPTPTASTPPPSSRLEQKGLQKLVQRKDQQRLAHQQSTITKSPHERPQGSGVDYSAQFPTTWAYARSTSSSLRPVKNMDEALVWIQQNNRLVQENRRLQKELEEVNQARAALARKLRELGERPTDEGSDEQKRINETLQQVRSEERARWAENVERLECQVRQLQRKT